MSKHEQFFIIPTTDSRITSHLAAVNQRLMSPSFGDLADGYAKLFGSLVGWLVALSGMGGNGHGIRLTSSFFMANKI